MKNLNNARKKDIKEKILDIHSGSPKKYKVKYYKKVCRLINNFRKYCNCDYDKIKSITLQALGSACKYCGDKITAKNLSGDHITPLTRGGVSYLDNFQIICNSCNQRKGDLSGSEYEELLKVIDKWDDSGKRYILTQLRKSDYYGS